MKPIAPGGLLVAIEGVDGAGKTTVSALLAQYCGERGIACTLSKEPTGLGAGVTLRESAKNGRATPAAELALFLEDRAAHVHRSIRPALDFGAVVILDRYYWSTAAYQGARGIDPFAIIAANEKIAPTPDLVILLDLPPADGLTRVRARGDVPNTFETEDALQQSRDIFLQLHRAYSDTSVRIDATPDLRAVHAQARAAFLTAIERKTHCE
jgi:dTMP kinase